MAPSFKAALLGCAIVLLGAAAAAQSDGISLQLPCVPAPVMEADLRGQGFAPLTADEDGDGDAWIRWVNKDGRWVLMLYLVEPKAQCFVARGGVWPEVQGRGDI